MEQVRQRVADVFGLLLRKIVVESRAAEEESGILGIQAEYQPDVTDV